jgi:hypothetical protein
MLDPRSLRAYAPISAAPSIDPGRARSIMDLDFPADPFNRND